ncbi:carboxypeptidase-like regulatory domain-containing protein [Flavobacterium sp.]|uniref:carboxypeptidase-like regulatory domain-containing protein n=1 Tax=Flavobacterium sp. TaxID=239 RepID=UPI0026195F47|nr:carboxypeptidase-like regulatory domain-containing protein [Flavobacterium sp.]
MEKINIQINQPCSENFNTFSKTEKGGFCKSCNKSVIDFTKMSDEEIIKYFSDQKVKTCGLFLDSQLKSYSDVAKQKLNPFLSSIFGLSLLSILAFTTSYAQEKSSKSEVVQKEKTAVSKESNQMDSNDKFTVSGIVSNEIGPLADVNIYVKNKNISVQTNSQGKFTFPQQLTTDDVLIVSYIGYKNQEIKVSRQNQSDTINLNIKLDTYERIMLGEVSTDKIYKSKRTVFQKIKSLFTND